MIRTKYEQNIQQFLLPVIIGLLVFQNALETVYSGFAYIDELVALAGVCMGLYDFVVIHRGRPSREQVWIGLPLLLFVAVGLAGNLLYRYQPLKCVIIDLFTNLKFFFAIGTGYYLFQNVEWKKTEVITCRSAAAYTLILFTLFVLDRIYNIWPCEVRYGFSSVKLFYSHPTYLAGATAFLISLLTVFFKKRNLPLLAMNLLMMALTLRAKSLASTAVYVAMFTFFFVLKKDLKLWNIVAGGIGCVAIAWDKINFYFVKLAGNSARSVILQKSFQVMKDYFPIGTGFGTFGSAEAAKHYSPVYMMYDFNDYYELRDVRNVDNTLRLIRRSPYLTEQYKKNPEGVINGMPFLSDAFWPTIFGQTGFLGTVLYAGTLATVFAFCLKVRTFNRKAYVSVLFAMLYLLISSVAEPAFHNSVSIGLALTLGIVFFGMVDARKKSGATAAE